MRTSRDLMTGYWASNTRRRGRSAAVLVALVAVVATASAQPTPQAAALTSDPARPLEVAELDAFLGALVQEQGEAAREPANLIELSRLLAVPCDQLLWLGRQVAALKDQPDAARALAEQARQRAATLADLAGDCAEQWPLWLAAPEAKRRLPDVLDPAELKARLEQVRAGTEPLGDLTDFEKLLLLSRGADDALLIDRRAAPAWDTPRQAVSRLVQSPRLPGFTDLRSLERSLADAYAASREPGAAGFDAEQTALVAMTFQVAAALLDRALGLDSDDVAAARYAMPIPYVAAATEWRQHAAALEQAGLRSWAALAYALAAGRSAGEPVDADTAAAARRLWADVRTVNDKVWPLLDTPPDGWFPRMESPDRLVATGAMPLAAGFHAADRQARRRHEEDILALISGARDANDEATADRLLQSIQRAKAADLGLDTGFKPLDLAGLQKALGCDQSNWVYLFIETLRLHEAGGPSDATYCGVAIYRTEYTSRMEGRPYSDRCRARIVRWNTSLRGVVEEALRDGPPPLSGRRDTRILIAPDGPPPADWFPYEHGTLLPSSRWEFDPAWVVYTPSAGALNSGPWTLEQTLRAWYRSAVRHETSPPYLRAADFQAGVRPGPPLEPNTLGMSLHRLYLADVQVAETKLKEFLDRKRQQELRVIPLWVSQGRP